MSSNTDGHYRREKAEEHYRELRDQFMDLATLWVQLRQRFLIAHNMQPPDERERR